MASSPVHSENAPWQIGTSASLAGGFTYVAVLGVTSVAPNSGPATGGTSVAITGTNFQTGATVRFGGTLATAVTVVSSTQIAATAPAHAVGHRGGTQRNLP